MEIIEKKTDKPWNWRGISSNPNITMEIIEKYPDKPWNWSGISYNPNITMEIIEKNPDKDWEWGSISISIMSFNKEKQSYLLHKHREYVKLNLSEDLAMISNHPLKVEQYLNMGYDIEELDDIM